VMTILGTRPVAYHGRSTMTGKSRICAKKYTANPYALQTRRRNIPMPAHKGTSAKGRITIGPSALEKMTLPAITNAATDAILGNLSKVCISRLRLSGPIVNRQLYR
jgi:hypothetical protein